MSIKLRRYTEIALILSSLFIVSGTLSFWYGMKKENNIANINQMDISLDTTMDNNEFPIPVPPQLLQNENEHFIAEKTYLLTPLLVTRDIQKIALFLRNDPILEVTELARQLVSDQKSFLSYTDKVKLILSLALNYPYLNEQSSLFNLLIDNKKLFLTAKSTPLLFIAADPLYINIIQNLLVWAKHNEKNYPGLYQKIVKDGLSYTVSQDKIDKLILLVQMKVHIDPIEATALLWQVVQQNKNPHFVSLLKDCGAQLDDIKSKKTPLIQAVTNNNFELTKALLNAGAKINLIPDPAVGSALQNALLAKHIEIELLLRERGAKE